MSKFERGIESGGVGGGPPEGIARLHIAPPYGFAVVVGMLMSGVGAGVLFGLGTAPLWGGLLPVVVTLTATLRLLRLGLNALGPKANQIGAAR